MNFKERENLITDRMLRQELEKAPDAAKAVAALRRRLHTQIILTVAALIISVAAGAAFISKAWYASNAKVDGSDIQITTESKSPSLFIRPATDSAINYATSIERSGGASLFPISTANLKDWYYASDFEFGKYVDGVYVGDAPHAIGYTKAQITEDGLSGSYINSFEGDTVENGNTHVAYYVAKNNLYTDKGTANVFLAPDDEAPITVTLATGGSAGFMDAVRVGIGTADAAGENVTMKLVYAPVAENGTGNSQYASGPAFKAINPDGNLNNNFTAAAVSLTTYQAIKVPDTDDTYEAPEGRIPLGLANSTSGLNVYVYVWLEGTDNQAMIGVSDDDIAGISVNLNYVCVEVSRQ